MLAPNAEVSIFPWKEPKSGFRWRCANPFLPQGASACLDGGVFTTGPGRVRFTFPDGLDTFHLLEDHRLCTNHKYCKSSGRFAKVDSP